MALLFVILLTVTLSPPFGDAEAHALGAPSALTFDVSVQVEGEPTAVIARITGLAGELDPVALVPRGGGTYGQAIKLTAWEDVQVSFEYIAADGTTTISAASSLIELGVDPELIRPSVPGAEPTSESGVDPKLIAGLAAAVATVVFLGFWASGALSDTRMKTDDWTFSATVDDADEAGSTPDDEPVTTDDAAG